MRFWWMNIYAIKNLKKINAEYILKKNCFIIKMSSKGKIMDSLFQMIEEISGAIEDISVTSASVEGIFIAIAGILSTIAGMLGLGISVLGAIVGVISAIIGFIVAVIEFIVPAIALFKMGKKAGYKHSWLAFVPIVQTYVEFVLPRKQFNIGIIKTYKRDVIAIIFIILTYFGTTIVTFANGLVGLGQILTFAFVIFMGAIRWRKMYDLLSTFRDEELAKIISIVGIFAPIVYNIVIIFSMNKEPNYGAGNYYNVPMTKPVEEQKPVVTNGYTQANDCTQNVPTEVQSMAVSNPVFEDIVTENNETIDNGSINSETIQNQ